MTKRNFFELVIAKCGNDAELVGFARHELELLDARNIKRASKSKDANAPFKSMIIDYLNGKDFTVGSDIAKALDLSTQKTVGLCGSLVKDGVLVKAEVNLPKIGKRIAYKVKE